MTSGIYCYENLIDHKKYVGQSANLERREKEHERIFSRSRLSSPDNSLLWKAVKKYGRQNFVYYIIDICDENMLDDKETYFIQKLKSHVTDGGYNLSWGGEAFARGMKFSDESKKKLSESVSGQKNGFYGKHHSDDVKRRISDWRIAHKDEWFVEGDTHFNRGRHHSDGSKSKMSESRMGERNWHFGKKSTGASSKYHGVLLNKRDNTWISRITYQGIRTVIGYFKEEIDAAKAYDRYVDINNLPHVKNFGG